MEHISQPRAFLMLGQLWRFIKSTVLSTCNSLMPRNLVLEACLKSTSQTSEAFYLRIMNFTPFAVS